ncbi:MAG: hypothetical protein BWY57_02159 [Betaproteobacteria bacterium ADurb.Bin341]|nr:MAG: hypothetical protein BWY57_02159 [Betaproteobacteria bacterium ADurb.Bin341]
MILTPQPETGRWQGVVFTALVHGALLAFLFIGVQWKRSPPQTVQVELWSSRPGTPVSIAPPPPPQIKVEPEKPPVPAPPPEAAPQPVEKPDIALPPEKKPKPKPVPQQPKPVPQSPAKEKPQPSSSPRPYWEKALRSEEIASAVERAEGELAASAAGQRALASWMERIAGKIRGNTVQPPNLRGNPVVVFRVSLLPSGEIISVKLKRSSGVPAWDGATERAILKSSPLPKPDDLAVFSREFDLKLCPDEQGCD